MRVAAIAHYGLPDNRGGSEVMLHELLSALVRAGHRADLYVTDSGGATVEVGGVTVYRGRRHLAAVDRRYDFLITHHKEAPSALDRARSLGVPSALIVHSDLAYNREFLRREPEVVVFNSEWVRQHYAERGWTGRSLVVHPPVWGADHRTVRGDMVTLINPLPEKGARLFYQLARLMPDTEFLAVEGGYGHERQLRLDYPNVTWQPHTDDMARDVWSRTRVLLMPSSYESWGMAGVEAMHSGIPVIAHPTAGLRESLGGAGTFVNRNQAAEWRLAIRRLWDNKAASDRARRRAEELDPAPQLARWVEEVESCVSRSRLLATSPASGTRRT